MSDAIGQTEIFPVSLVRFTPSRFDLDGDMFIHVSRVFAYRIPIISPWRFVSWREQNKNKHIVDCNIPNNTTYNSYYSTWTPRPSTSTNQQNKVNVSIRIFTSSTSRPIRRLRHRLDRGTVTVHALCNLWLRVFKCGFLCILYTGGVLWYSLSQYDVDGTLYFDPVERSTRSRSLWPGACSNGKLGVEERRKCLLYHV